MQYSIKLIVLLLAVFLVSCRSEFETIRTSTDPELILKKADAYYDADEYQRAQTLYELVIAPYRGRAEAEQIAYRYAYTYYYTEQFVLASYYFKNFATTYGGSALREEADFMSAYSNYELSPIYRLDQSYSVKAIEGFEEFANRYPNSERVAEANRLIDEMRAKMELKDFESAKLYMDIERYESALTSFENVLKEYPETKRAEEIRYLMAKVQYEYADRSFRLRKPERLEATIALANNFLARFPNSQWQTEVTTILSKSQKELNDLADVRYQSTSTGT
ncbi:Outer membrane protein assembly factor BamD [Neolewinella maritima]|uniref:Outer membrane protein assembly factor BamD n=1 Tax=Neolewinella maritima TaxID=1383882 RepID=A0ABM9B5J7_9BACT|nr:outer membrane protein assembly factor BamD [Neolewinella maritima]CAH1002206.1 Outer membrane protein assembly factor BamD [Neolewinella maritima]